MAVALYATTEPTEAPYELIRHMGRRLFHTGGVVFPLLRLRLEGYRDRDTGQCQNGGALGQTCIPIDDQTRTKATAASADYRTEASRTQI